MLGLKLTTSNQAKNEKNIGVYKITKNQLLDNIIILFIFIVKLFIVVFIFMVAKKN